MINVDGSAIVISRPKMFKNDNSFYCVFQLLSVEEVQKEDKVIKITTKCFARCWDSSATAFIKTVNKGDTIKFKGVLRTNEHDEVYVRLTSFEKVENVN